MPLSHARTQNQRHKSRAAQKERVKSFPFPNFCSIQKRKINTPSIRGPLSCKYSAPWKVLDWTYVVIWTGRSI